MENVKDQLIGETWPVLDDGHVQLIDVMGDDQAITDAARVSYGKGTKRIKDDRDLIRYLMRHHHGTPFEMAEIKIRVRVPMDCWRQWIRHRVANVNEYSTRYSEAIDSAQKTAPDAWRAQSGTNKQGSDGAVVAWPEGVELTGITGQRDFDSPGHYLTAMEAYIQHKARAVYEERLRFGVAREQARKDLPLSTYTEAYWKCDLRNVLHFLGLRMDGHAQAEIRAYAEVIGREIVAPLFPLAWEAFEDYQLKAMSLSYRDQRVIHNLATVQAVTFDRAAELANLTNKREIEECRAKLTRLGMIPGR